MSVSGSVDVHQTEIPTAACRYDEDRGSHDILLRDGDVVIANSVQQKSKFDSDQLSLLAKEGMLYHELGHVLYTDHGAWEAQLATLDQPPKREQLANLLNIMEDSVIEAYLVENFNIDTLLAYKNENKHKTLGVFAGGSRDDPSQLDPYFQKPLTTLDVSCMAFEEFGRYSLGVCEEHLSDSDRTLSVIGDEFTATEVIKKTVEVLNACVQEPVASERYDMVVDLFDDLWTGNECMDEQIDREDLDPQISNSPPGSEQEQNSFLIQTPDIDPEGGDDDDDDEQDGAGQEDGDEAGGAGGDGEEQEGEESDDEGAGGAGGDEEADIDGVIVGGGGQDDDGDDEGEDGSDGDEAGSGGQQDDGEDGESGGAGEEGDDDDDEVPDPDIASGDMEGGDFGDAAEQSGVVDDGDDSEGQQSGAGIDVDIPDELEAAFNAAGASEAEVLVREEPEAPQGYDPDRVAEAVRKSRSIQRIVEDFLHQREKSRTDRNRVEGQFDDQNLINAERGSPRVFKREDKPDELNYHAVLMLDESGSMGGMDIQMASMAVAALARGFEEAGVDVDVYRFGSNVNLCKTAAEDWDGVSDLLLDTYAGGGTNMLPALQQIEDRADLHDKQSFLVNITDGQPASSQLQECKDLIRNLDMPTLSMQIKTETDAFDGIYDGLENVNSSAGIESSLRSLVRRTVFK
jgi:Mg-chelatase subunit ChlD